MFGFGALTFRGTFAPGRTIRARLIASPTYAEAPSCFGVAVNDTFPRRSVSGRAKYAFTSAVAAAGESPPTRTAPATVTPAGIVEGRGGGGATGVVVVGGGVVVVGGGVVVVGGGAVVVGGGAVVVVTVWASADDDAASRTAESTPAPAHATSREKVSPLLTRGV